MMTAKSTQYHVRVFAEHQGEFMSMGPIDCPMGDYLEYELEGGYELVSIQPVATNAGLWAVVTTVVTTRLTASGFDPVEYPLRADDVEPPASGLYEPVR